MAPHPSEKVAWRRELLGARRAMTTTQREVAAEAMAAHLLAHPLLTASTRVACYLSMTSEPGTDVLIAGLRSRGTAVMVPRVEEQGLAWVVVNDATTYATGSLGMREPHGEAADLHSASLVILPALAIDHHGHRLGRGAGYYDRALATSTIPRCALVFADELVASLPHEAHDVPVDFAVSPHGIFRIDRT